MLVTAHSVILVGEETAQGGVIRHLATDGKHVYVFFADHRLDVYEGDLVSRRAEPGSGGNSSMTDAGGALGSEKSTKREILSNKDGPAAAIEMPPPTLLHSVPWPYGQVLSSAPLGDALFVSASLSPDLLLVSGPRIKKLLPLDRFEKVRTQ